MKLCVLGGGGVRSCFLAKSIAWNAALAKLDEVVLMDIDAYKLEKYGELARQIAVRIDPKLKVTLTCDPREALQDADFVITTIRAGQDASRVRDENIASGYGLLGQETTGACGFAMAMRSIPVLLKYCQIAREVAHPDCLIFNFTNPSGLVTQALTQAGYPVYGICDAPSELIKQLAALLHANDREFTCNCFGLNHLSWFNQFRLHGKDVKEELFQHPDLFTKTEMRLFDPDILKLTEGHLLNEYLYFYYYNHRVIAANLQAAESRAQLIARVNREMNEALRPIDVARDFEKAFKIFFEYYNIRENNYMKNESGKPRVHHYDVPDLNTFLTTPDEGGYAGVALRFVRAYMTNEPVDMILSTANRGAIRGLRDEDVVEITCTVDRNGAHPKPQQDIPDSIFHLILTMKEYERTAVRAIVNRDKTLAVKALLLNPLVADVDLARKLIDDFLQYEADGERWP